MFGWVGAAVFGIGRFIAKGGGIWGIGKSLLTGGGIDRVLQTIDKNIDAQNDRERIKGEIIQSYYATRTSYMRAGGFWLMILFAIPLAFWFGSVCVYSVLWCADCAYPQDWTVAALPPPIGATADGSHQGWAGIIITSIFGVVGVSALSGNLKKK